MAPMCIGVGGNWLVVGPAFAGAAVTLSVWPAWRFKPQVGVGVRLPLAGPGYDGAAYEVGQRRRRRSTARAEAGSGVPNAVRIGRTLLTYPARSIASAPTGNAIMSSRKVPGVRLEIDGFRASVPTESPISPRARLVSSR
jgi:hypothetical protein